MPLYKRCNDNIYADENERQAGRTIRRREGENVDAINLIREKKKKRLSEKIIRHR